MFSTNSKFLRAVVAVMTIFAVCSTARAAEIYDNGDPIATGAFRMDTQGTVGMNTWHPYDDFSFTRDKTVTGVEVVLTSHLSLDEWRSAAFTDSMTYEVREDDTGCPGPPLDGGCLDGSSVLGNLGPPLDSGSLFNPVLSSSTSPTFFEHTIVLSFDLERPFDALTDTTYWLGIQSPPSVGFLVANWALSVSMTGNPGKSTPNNGLTWHMVNGGDASFKLFGPDRIDIKPWRFPNRINPRFRFISVAVFGAKAFDDDPVDPTTLKFGPEGTAAFPWVFEGFDVDHDGLKDFIVFFRPSRSGIQCGATEATVTGETFSGKSFFATDSITTIGCGKKRRRWSWR